MAKNEGSPDLRIKRTRRAIRKAFFELVEEKGFDHVCVKDITDRAMISRNTFYLHYKDKYDLLNKICDDMTKEIFNGVGEQLKEEKQLKVDTNSAARVLELSFSIIEKDKNAYRILLLNSDTDVLSTKLEDVIRRALNLISSEIASISQYSIEYTVSGITGLIKYQVSKGDDVPEIDYKTFAELHLGNIVDSIHKNRKKQVKH